MKGSSWVVRKWNYLCICQDGSKSIGVQTDVEKVETTIEEKVETKVEEKVETKQARAAIIVKTGKRGTRGAVNMPIAAFCKKVRRE